MYNITTIKYSVIIKTNATKETYLLKTEVLKSSRDNPDKKL